MGLPYIDLTEDSKSLCLITTVRNNFQGFTKAQITKGTKAREVLAKIGYPTEREFVNITAKKRTLYIYLQAV